MYGTRTKNRGILVKMLLFNTTALFSYPNELPCPFYLEEDINSLRN